MSLTKNVLAFLVLAFAFYYAQSAIFSDHEIESRANLVIGSLGVNDLLLYRQISTKNATVGVQGRNDVIYRGFATNITYITAIENGITQNATAMLISGGLRQSNATIRLTSAISRGFNYTVSIYGR